MRAYETEALATEAETKAFTEAETKAFSLEAEARPRRLKFQPRRGRAETQLETASRLRQHPWKAGTYRYGQAVRQTDRHSLLNLLRGK